MSNAENAGSAAEQEPNLAPNTDAEPSDPALADTEPTAEATSDAVGDSARTAIATPATPIRGSAAHTATMVRAKSALSPQALEALEQLEEKTLLAVGLEDDLSKCATPIIRQKKEGFEETVDDYQLEPLLIQEERNRRLKADAEVRQSMSQKSKRGGKSKQKLQTTMLHRDIVELEGFGFVDKFFYQLWRSETGTARFSEPHLMIPHTVLFNCGQPTKWFFTSKQSATFGEFQKKKRKNATSPAIFEEFMKQRKNRVSDVIAYYVSGKAYKAGEFEQPKVEFLDTEGFIEFMSPTRQMQMAHDEELGFLQVFVDPKNNFLTHGRKNFVLRVKWTPHICLVNARVNQVELDPQRSKKSIFDRAATFEGNSDGSQGAIVSDRLGQFLKQVSTKIVSHLEKRSPAVELIELNFKIDDNNTVWLLNCSSLQFHAGGNISRVLLSPDIGQADSQGIGSQRHDFSLCCQCLRCGTTVNNNYKCGVSFKQVLLHYMSIETVLADQKEKSKPRGSNRSPQQGTADSPEPILDLEEGLERLEQMGVQLEVPQVIQRADPRMNVELLLKAITKHDVEILYKVADVCSSCAQKILDCADVMKPRVSSLTGMSMYNDSEGTDAAMNNPIAAMFSAGMHEINDMPAENKDFVKFNSEQGGTTNKRRPHYAVDYSAIDIPDVSDATLDKILDTHLAQPQPPQRSYLKPKLQVPELASLASLQPRPPGDRMGTRECPWRPAGAAPSTAPGNPPRRPNRIVSNAMRQKPSGGAYGPVVLPATTRDMVAFSNSVGRDMNGPQTAREVRDRLPLIESGGFRPPRIPLTSRRGKRGTSAPNTADVAQIARDVIAYDPSGITLQVDHAKEASRLEVEADRLMVEAKLHRAAAKC